MRRLLFIFLIFSVASCTKQLVGDGTGSRLCLESSIYTSPATKVLFSGRYFPKDSSMGLFVYHSETEDAEFPQKMEVFTLYGTKYGNIMALFDSDNLKEPSRYMFDGASTDPFSDIYLLSPSESAFDEGLAVVAYAPWIGGVTSITSIPFKLGGMSKSMNDLMWAHQNHHDKTKYDDAGANYKIVPDGNEKKVRLTFHHALSLLRIGLRCKHSGSRVTLSSISLKTKSGSETKLYSGGRMNAMDGSITYDNEVSSLSYDYTDVEPQYMFSSTSDYVEIPMLVAPVRYLSDGDYILEFRFNGMELTSDDPQNVLQYPIMIEDVEGGFEQGKVYDFKFTIDNYIQFDDIHVSDQWIQNDSDKHNLPF